MKQNDKIDAVKFKAELVEVAEKLLNDNYTLKCMEELLIKFISSNKLKGNAYDSLRQQFYDYTYIFKEVQKTNEEMMREILAVRSYIDEKLGDEILDGLKLTVNMRKAQSEKEDYEAEAEEWQSKIDASDWFFERIGYRRQRDYCTEMAELCDKEYLRYKELSEVFDEIEYSTKNLLDNSLQSSGQRMLLTSIIKSFQSGEYIIDGEEDWRNNLRKKYIGNVKEVTWSSSIVTAAKAAGLSDSEIYYLRQQGVILTEEDIKVIKDSVGSTSATLATKQTSVIYNGKVYVIALSKDEEPCIGTGWKEVCFKTKSDIAYDLVKGITNIDTNDREGSDGMVFDNRGSLLQSSIDTMSGGASSMLLYSNILSAIDAGIETTYMAMSFQENGDYRRVIIGYGSHQFANKMANYKFDININSYSIQTSPFTRIAASNQAKNMYEGLTGITPSDDKTYTLISNISSAHKNQKYAGEVYFENGRLMLSPTVYAADKAYIATCDDFSGNNPKKLLDITDKLSTPYEILEKELFNETLK